MLSTPSGVKGVVLRGVDAATAGQVLTVEKDMTVDIWDGREYLYMVSPIVIGFFEFTMMRTGPDLPMARWAELFQSYMFGEKDFLEANFGSGQRVSVMRALPHEEALGEHVEILDYEKASSLIEKHTDRILCSVPCKKGYSRGESYLDQQA